MSYIGRLGTKLARWLRLCVVACILVMAPGGGHTVQSQGVHAGVCRNAFNGCDENGNPCDDFLSCYGDLLQDALFAVALAMALILVAEIVLPVAAVAAAEGVAAEGAAAAAEAAAAEAAAAEAAAAEAAAAEATAAEATAAEATAAEATAAEATADAASADETAAAAEEGAQATADADNVVDVPEGSNVIPQEIFNDFPALEDVNPGEFNDNCPACQAAGRQILDGGAPIQAGDSGPASMSSMQSDAGSYFSPMSIQQAEQQLLAAGDGANGTVAAMPPNSSIGHVFNAVNRGGQVVWVDAQNVTARTTAEIIAKWAGAQTWFMP